MINVYIADDHPIIREGLKTLVNGEPDMRISGEAASSVELLERISSSKADVLVLDLNMPEHPGLETLQKVRASMPKLHVLILTINPVDYLAVRTLRSGAAGYITKEAASEELLRAIRKVASGGRYVSSDLAEHLAGVLDLTADNPPHESLSDREYEVFLMIAGGKTGAEIADALGISPSTVNTYRIRLMDKMGMSSSLELMHYAVSNGLIKSPK